MTFLHQFSLLWLLALGASALFGVSICWLIISAAWVLWRRPSVNFEKRSNPSKPGELDALLTPPKKETAWIQIAKLLLLAAVILGAYDIGQKSEYSREHAAWQQRNAQWQRTFNDFMAKHKELNQ